MLGVPVEQAASDVRLSVSVIQRIRAAKDVERACRRWVPGSSCGRGVRRLAAKVLARRRLTVPLLRKKILGCVIALTSCTSAAGFASCARRITLVREKHWLSHWQISRSPISCSVDNRSPGIIFALLFRIGLPKAVKKTARNVRFQANRPSGPHWTLTGWAIVDRIITNKNKNKDDKCDDERMFSDCPSDGGR